MNDRQLDELLDLKKSVSVEFRKTPEEFAADFFNKVAERPERKSHYLAWAAGFLIVASVMAALMLPLRNPMQTDTKLTEAVRLFGNDAAVLFLENELVTGERNSWGRPNNFIDIILDVGKKKIRLALACSDDDSITVENPSLSGAVVVSRLDASTLVLDLELCVNGKRIRTAIPVVRQGRNHYTEDKLS